MSTPNMIFEMPFSSKFCVTMVALIIFDVIMAVQMILETIFIIIKLITVGSFTKQFVHFIFLYSIIVKT